MATFKSNKPTPVVDKHETWTVQGVFGTELGTVSFNWFNEKFGFTPNNKYSGAGLNQETLQEIYEFVKAKNQLLEK